MKTIKELREALGIMQTELDELGSKVKDEKRSYTTEERTQIEAKLDEMEGIEEEIRMLERLEKRNATATKKDPEPAKDPEYRTLSAQPTAEIEEYKFGEFLQDVAKRTIASQTGGTYVSPRFDLHQKRNIEAARIESRATGLSEGIPSDGGFLVGTDYNPQLITKVHETGILKPRTRQIPLSANSNGISLNGIDETSRADGYRWGGIRVYRNNEGGTKTASKPKFRKIKMDAEKMIGMYYSTDELLEDTAALAAVVTQGFVEEFGYKIDDEIINGTGAGEMLGILNADCLISQAAEDGQDEDTIVYANIMKMWSRMWSKSKPNSVWLVNSNGMPQLQAMSLAIGTGGSAVFVPPGGLSASPYGALLGRPIIEIEQAQTLGTVGDIMLVDLSQYVTIDKGGMQSASSIHVQFVTDETAFRFVMRNNGQPTWNAALTPAKTTTTVSPFVALASRE